MDDSGIRDNVIEIASLITVPTNDNRPHLEVTINGHAIFGLLDSGANVTMLGAGAEDIIESLNLPLADNTIRIRTADGSIHSTSNVAEIPYSVNGQTEWVNTLIIPTIATKLILGTDFWKIFHIWPMINCVAETHTTIPAKIDTVNMKHNLSEEQLPYVYTP